MKYCLLFFCLLLTACATQNKINVGDVPTIVIDSFKAQHSDVILADWYVVHRFHRAYYVAKYYSGDVLKKVKYTNPDTFNKY